MSLQAVPGSSCPPALAQGMQYTSTQEAKIGESQAGFVLTWQHCEQLHVHSLPSPPSLPNLPGPLPLHMDSKASKSQRVEHGFEWNKISHEAKQELLLHSCATMSQNRNTDSTWCNNRTLVTLRPNTHRTSRHGVESPNHWNSTRPPGWNAEPQSASEGAAAPETEGQSASRFHFLVSIHCQETNRRPTAWRKEPDQSSQQIATRSQPSDFQKKTKKDTKGPSISSIVFTAVILGANLVQSHRVRPADLCPKDLHAVIAQVQQNWKWTPILTFYDILSKIQGTNRHIQSDKIAHLENEKTQQGDKPFVSCNIKPWHPLRRRHKPPRDDSNGLSTS